MVGMAEVLDTLVEEYHDCAGMHPSGSTDIGAILVLRGLSVHSSSELPRAGIQSIIGEDVEEGPQRRNNGESSTDPISRGKSSPLASLLNSG